MKRTTTLLLAVLLVLGIPLVKLIELTKIDKKYLAPKK